MKQNQANVYLFSFKGHHVVRAPPQVSVDAQRNGKNGSAAGVDQQIVCLRGPCPAAFDQEDNLVVPL